MEQLVEHGAVVLDQLRSTRVAPRRIRLSRTGPQRLEPALVSNCRSVKELAWSHLLLTGVSNRA